jgi:hypothetical protein
MKAVISNETDRFSDFNETKSTAITEIKVQQTRYARWTFEIESRERRVSEKTPCSENSDLPTNANASSQQTISSDKRVVAVYNKPKTTGRRIAADEVN